MQHIVKDGCDILIEFKTGHTGQGFLEKFVFQPVLTKTSFSAIHYNSRPGFPSLPAFTSYPSLWDHCGYGDIMPGGLVIARPL